MSKEIIEVIHGKHRVYHVIADRRLFAVDYHVKSTDGQIFATFKRLDVAVHWARIKAVKH